ncbi:MAG: CAP domain-containing protein [Polyangiaceae bacterium]|nr:CAP domain-containing protein [Polyangiaceae bacterium]
MTDRRLWLRTLAGAIIGAGCGCASLLDFDDVTFEPTSDAAAGSGGLAFGGNPGGGAAGGPSGGAAGAGGGAGGAGGGAASGGGGSGGAPSGGGTSSGGAPAVACSPSCAYGFYCDPTVQLCKCLPGFVQNGTSCEPILPGDPATHTQSEVCQRWQQGNQLTDFSPWTAGPTECDPGTTSRAGITDAMARINMYRWLVGLGPAVDDPDMNESLRSCAVLASWNPPGTVPNPHSPPSTAKCYTAQGASGTGSSNLSWGVGVAEAITQFIIDNGNDTTFGHRRWILSAGTGVTGIGHYAGGGPYGAATCQYAFGGGTTYPAPSWISLPPPGFSPTEVVNYDWTFHASVSVGSATITVTRVSDNQNMAMTKLPLSGGYGSYQTVAFRKQGWSAQAGQTYQVTISDISGGPIAYEVKPVACN